MRNLTRCFFRVLLVALAGSVQVATALSSDSSQPIEIEADFAELDEQAGRTIYKGNVELTQGSLRLFGDSLVALFDDQNELVRIELTGVPARFKQRPDDAKVDIEGEALKIDYRKAKSLLRLITRAKLTKGQQLFEGNQIDYDTELAVIKARGASTTAPSNDAPSGNGGRVRIVIPPKASNP